MPADYDLIPKQPLESLNKSLSIDLKGFALSLAKLALFYVKGDGKDLGEAAIDGFQSVALKDKAATPEQAAWVLIFNAFGNSFYALIHEYKDLLTHQELEKLELEDIAAWFSHRLNQVEIQLDASFFDHPQEIILFEDFKPILIDWLKQFKFDEAAAEAFYLRLKRRFVLELHEEWGKNAAQYQELLQRLQTPFTNGTQQEREWKKYRAHLINEADARVFGEAFGLRQIYISLRAYTEEKPCTDKRELEPNEKTKKIVCDLHTTIHAWSRQFDKEQALKLISGGPGCGKSSFAKVLAAELSEQRPELTVVFIPLHHFRLDDDVVEALSAFVRDERYLKTNPLHCDTRHERVLLIFDGLDELAMQGKAAAESAQYFVEQVSRLLERHNDQGRAWQALITGRELAIQANTHQLRKAQQVLHVLPYFLTKDERKSYEDKQGLLSTDQRQLWWAKFGLVKGQDYQALPEDLDTEYLLPITREPLLNYLIALSYERQEIEFNEQTNLNVIYEDLLKAVFERNYAGKRQHLGAKNLSQKDFLKVLEEVALAVWHGNGRTASISYLKKRFEENKLNHLLEKLQEDAQKGVVRLLTAFYFRQAGKDENHDPTFEFTHKSFGEYLTAKRLVRAVSAINKRYQDYLEELEEHNSIPELLKTWIKLTGITALDEHIAKFIGNELARENVETLKQYQETFTRLLEYAINQGSPVDKLGLNSFYAMLEHSRNGEEALLIICSACSTQTNILTSIKWSKTNSFGTWNKRMQAQRIGTKNKLFSYYLINIDLSNQIVHLGDFHNYSFKGSNLRGIKAFRCDFQGTQMANVNLKDADLRDTCLADADLTGSDFRNSDLTDSDLRCANLENTDLTGANLRHANLRYAYLRGANLRGTKLRGTDLKGTNLSDTIYEGHSIKEIIK